MPSADAGHRSAIADYRVQTLCATHTYTNQENRNQDRSHAHSHQEQANTTLTPATPGMNCCIAGNNYPTNQMHRFMVTATHRHTVSFPPLLQGSRCYTDASTVPDQVSSLPRKAGIGIFNINTQVQPPQNIYIKAAMQHSTSVLMAEAAAITAQLQLQHTNFLSDSQQLVDFLNSSDHSNPPDWRIKYLTQLFDNFSRNRSTGTFKKQRNFSLLLLLFPISVLIQIM